MLTEILPASARPRSLFDDIDAQQRSASLMSTLDLINRHMGSGTMQLLGEGLRKCWAMKCGNLSQRCTTEWGELPSVQASVEWRNGKRHG